MQFSAIIAVAFSSAAMASPSFMDGLLKTRQDDVSNCLPTTFTDALCTVGNTLFCSNVNTVARCPDGQVEKFININTLANEGACVDLVEADPCTMTVFCCPQ